MLHLSFSHVINALSFHYYSRDKNITVFHRLLFTS